MESQTKDVVAFGSLVPRGDGTFIFKPRVLGEWVSVAQAARAARVDRCTMLRWAKTNAGGIVGRKRGVKLWEVRVDSLPV